jgi:hypothetical protein
MDEEREFIWVREKDRWVCQRKINSRYKAM